MQAQAPATSTQVPERLPPLELHPGRSVTAAAPPDAPAHGTAQAATPAPQPRAGAAAAPAEGAVAVRYSRDEVAGIWVTQIYDGESGELLRTVPDTQIAHQLETLRRILAEGSHVDARA